MKKSRIIIIALFTLLCVSNLEAQSIADNQKEITGNWVYMQMDFGDVKIYRSDKKEISIKKISDYYIKIDPNFVKSDETDKQISYMLWGVDLIQYTFDGTGNYYIFDSEKTNKYLLKKDKIIMINGDGTETTNNYSFDNGYLVLQNKKDKIPTKLYLMKNNY